MPATYEPIATTTLGSAASSITFSSISGSYTDLRCVLVFTGNGGNASASLRVNGDSGSNYSLSRLTGDGASASSSRDTSQTNILLTGNPYATSTIPQLTEIDIFSYAGSTNKTFLVKASADRNGAGYVEYAVALWRNTSAITSIVISSAVNNFATGTTATLYGILKA